MNKAIDAYLQDASDNIDGWQLSFKKLGIRVNDETLHQVLSDVLIDFHLWCQNNKERL